jgi:hypothetical protein
MTEPLVCGHPTPSGPCTRKVLPGAGGCGYHPAPADPPEERHPDPMATCDCERPLVLGRAYDVTHPLKRFCSERCQRAAECRRYRARRTEPATCQRCGTTFERSATTKRLKVYCSLECQYEARSVSYRARPDIKAHLKGGRKVVVFS